MHSTKQCLACKYSDLEIIKYSNHVNKINKSIVKHFVGSLFFYLVSFTKTKLYYWLKSKLLFSPKYHINRCMNCGYAVYSREISESELKHYYNNIYWNSSGTIVKNENINDDYKIDPRANGQYNCVKNYLKNYLNIDLLEIGAGEAYFSRLLRENYKRNIMINVVEPGERWRSYYNKLKIHLAADFFPFKSKNKYNYIHTSHWLEHVYDLNLTINKIKDLLGKNGLVFVEVPNCNSEYFSLNIGDTPHIHFFTVDSIKLIFENKGFECLDINEYGLTNGEEFIRRNNPNNFNRNILEDANNSIKSNIPRAGGSSLRGLFKIIC